METPKREELARRYAAMSEDEFASLNPQDLTEEAHIAYKQENSKRGSLRMNNEKTRTDLGPDNKTAKSREEPKRGERISRRTRTKSRISLVPEERIVIESTNGILILTTRRVRYDSSEWGRSQLVSMTLDSIASCSLTTRSFPVLLVLGVVTVLVGVFSQHVETAIAAIAVGFALALFYLWTRRAVIAISSKGGASILAPTKGMERGEIVSFIESVERQKLSRRDLAE